MTGAPTSTRYLAAPGIGLALSLALVVCFTAPGRAVLHHRASSTGTASKVLDLSFDERPARTGYKTVDNIGSGSFRTSVVTENGGVLTRVTARTGTPASNGAGRFPSHDPSATGARAIVQVTDTGGADGLDPNKGDFTFGADFRLRANSETSTDGSTDNGDNLVQRGLFGATSQYKLQLDHRIATCRIKGADGIVVISSGAAIEPNAWYRARCTRSGSSVSIAVTSWDSTGQPTTRIDTATGVTGDLTPDSRSVPLSVGGKLTNAGTVVDASDQFNGRVDNVVLIIG